MEQRNSDVKVKQTNKGQFNTNFGFLMASIGSAVGLGNLWGFPYKMGLGGGFAFLLLYAVLAVVVGYPLMLSEIALGRKTQKACIEAYKEADKRFTFNGVLQVIVPFMLICFYCTFGGYIMKYLFASVGTLFSDGAITTAVAGDYFHSFYTNAPQAAIFMIIFLVLTVAIVLGGVSGGIERFCKYAMPALFVMLVIIVIRACTLPGAGAGLAFMFTPDFSSWTGKSFFSVLALAGAQMFFSLSLASGCIIAYGSYLGKENNLEKNAVIIPVADTIVAILAGMAVMPAVFAFGLEPSGGPGLLFVSLTTVFQSMGMMGKIFQLLFWLLVFIAAISSSIGMMEGGISAILDSKISAGKKANRTRTTLVMATVALLGNLLTTFDSLGEGGLPHLLGLPTWLDFWDFFAEGLLMPLSGLIMAILLGWFKPHYIDDEIGKNFKSKGFYNFCIKWLAPIFMAFILYGQITSFF